MPPSAIGRNAVWNIAEVLVGSAVLFIVYRSILHHLGVSAMGVWALVVSATAVGRVADVGMASGLGRYVALCVARNDPGERILTYVETALITNAVLYLALSALIYGPAWWALGLATHGENLVAARALLPYAIIAFLAQNLSTVVIAALVGQHRSGLKSQLSLVTLSLQGLAALILVRSHGLVGLAVAQIGQYVLVLVAGWILVHREVDKGRWFAFPTRLDREALRDLMGFGLRMQGLTLASFLYEPLTKFVLSSVLGVSALGFYEVVSRGVLQVRMVLLAPSQNLTPSFTNELHVNPDGIGRLYDRAVVLLASSGAVAMALMAIGSPVISLIWFGRIEPLFVVLSVIVAAGWWVNIAAVPGYYLGVASARLRWNIIGAALTTTVSPLAAWTLGAAAGAPGAVGGVMLGVATGAMVTAVMNSRDAKLSACPSARLYVDTLGNEVAMIRRLFSKSA